MGTLYQLIIDRSIAEEVKTYNRDDWMLGVCKLFEIPENIITLPSSLMRKCKTRLEIWKDREKKYKQMD